MTDTDDLGELSASVTLEDIEAAATRIAGAVRHTPLLESATLSRRIGGRLLVKAESLQAVGSFKIRGALNLISQLSPEQRKRGVVAFSSGNHAQAVAAVAARFGIPCAIVMPKDAPAAKIEGTRSHGAEIVPYDREREDREAITREIAERRKAAIVPPFDDPRVIAGQGTVGLEIAEDCRRARIVPDVVLVPCSGGGLVAGIATALAARSPSTQIYAVEPAGFDDTARSLAAGRRVANTAGPGSLCDALMVNKPGKITFAINRRRLAGVVTVTDDEVTSAMKTAFSELRLVAEPSGAAGLAAALGRKLDLKGKTVVVVLSGGNIDAALFARILSGASPR